MKTNNKLREALMQIYDRVNSLDENCGVDPVEIRDIAKAALSAPPRNCDKSRDYILAALKHEKNVDPIFTVRLVVDFMLAEAREGGAK